MKPVLLQSQMWRFQPSLQWPPLAHVSLVHLEWVSLVQRLLTPVALWISASLHRLRLCPSMNMSLTQPTKPRPREAVHTSGGRIRACRSSGKPPRYMSPSRSRISLPSLAVKGMLWLFTEIKPAGKALALSQSEGFCCRRKRVGDTWRVSLRLKKGCFKVLSPKMILWAKAEINICSGKIRRYKRQTWAYNSKKKKERCVSCEFC